MKSKIIFIERDFPSANMVLINDEMKVLIDTGYKTDIKETEDLLKEHIGSLDNLDLLINTHYHSDHVGGNHHFQKTYNTKIAAHSLEATLINNNHPEFGCSKWLDQPIDKYKVDQVLSGGQSINTGSIHLEVIETPGHTLGHISLYCPEEKTLICGDILHLSDVGWFNIYREGIACMGMALNSLHNLLTLDINLAYSGHGKQMDDPKPAIQKAITRMTNWLDKPEKVAWHACKRIFSFSLIMKDGLKESEINNYLLSCHWFNDMAIHSFNESPNDFIPILIKEMIRSGAAYWENDKLFPTATYNVAIQ